MFGGGGGGGSSRMGWMGGAHGMLVLALQLVDMRNGEFAWEQTQPNIQKNAIVYYNHNFGQTPKISSKVFFTWHPLLLC